jgi:hypothetical protein
MQQAVRKSAPGLIHQSEEETRHYQGGYEPDFVLPHLQAAFEDLRTWSGKHDTTPDKQDKMEESNEDLARQTLPPRGNL